jgi:DNA invertase Pin-like site-specific DNA recombinase
MQIAIYTRVSTDTQADKEFNSCETQELKIKSFISSQENMVIFKVYSDQGYSGSNLNRPALIEMLQAIQQGKIDLVISYKIDRLTRSPKDFYQLIEVFEKHQVNFISVTERFDTSTPSGRLLRNIMLTFAQFERELISERTRDKMVERAKKGLWNSGHTPFGYKRADKKLVIDPQGAQTVKLIFETYYSTGSTAEVYKELKAANLLNRQGLPISQEEIRKILSRQLYAGKIEYKGNVYPGLHAPIISQELFDAVQPLRKHRIKKSKVFNYSIFPGMVHCKECGSMMSAVFANKIKNGKRTRYFYYRCSSVTKRDSSFCSTRQVSADRLDTYIIERLEKIAHNQQYLDSLIFTLNYQPQGRPTGVEPNTPTFAYTAEKAKEIIQRITNAYKLPGKNEKRLIIKKHIKQVNYSKEQIEVVINYPDQPLEVSGNGAEKSSAKNISAALFLDGGKKAPPRGL